MPEEKKNLIQKAAAVMGVVEHVPKTGRNAFHGYDYATESDIVAAVRKEMARQGLMLIPSVEKVEWGSVAKKNGGTDRLATLTVKFTLTDGNSSLDFTVLGEGTDQGDKATYKAMTGALKYALLKLFLIPTGDDPELDDEKPTRGAAAPAQPASNVDKVKAKVQAANGKGPDRVKAISDGLERLGFPSSDARKAKAAAILGHPFNPAHDADLTALEAWLQANRNITDAAAVLGAVQ
jgi:hypothetical protein